MPSDPLASLREIARASVDEDDLFDPNNFSEDATFEATFTPRLALALLDVVAAAEKARVQLKKGRERGQEEYRAGEAEALLTPALSNLTRHLTDSGEESEVAR